MVIFVKCQFIHNCDILSDGPVLLPMQSLNVYNDLKSFGIRLKQENNNRIYRDTSV